MNLSLEQKEIVQASFCLKDGEILKIDACAGSGKTSTLVEIVKANPDWEFLYLAFNRSIAEKAASVFPPNCTAMTIHSLAFRHMFHHRRPTIGNIKVNNLREKFPGMNNYQLYNLLLQYKDFLNSGQAVFPNRRIRKIFSLVESGELPCMHDHYLKLFSMLSSEDQGLSDSYDCLLIDESQDANPVMLSIAGKASCRKIFVGDSHQSIYGFRGAINALASQKASIVKHLSVSFRSTQEVLDKANLYVDFFNQEIYDGQVPYVQMKSSDRIVLRSKQTAFITRTNAKLVETIAEFMDNPKAILLLKRPEDIFRMPIAVHEFLCKGKRDFWGDLAFLNGFPGRAELSDYADQTLDSEILASIRLSDRYRDMLYVLKNRASEMCCPDAPVVVTNAHTSKGLEWHTVVLADDFPDLGDSYARCLLDPLPPELDGTANLSLAEERSVIFYNFLQELNLYYVAVTRAQVEVRDASANSRFSSAEELRKHVDDCVAKYRRMLEKKNVG